MNDFSMFDKKSKLIVYGMIVLMAVGDLIRNLIITGFTANVRTIGSGVILILTVIGTVVFWKVPSLHAKFRENFGLIMVFLVLALFAFIIILPSFTMNSGRR